MHIEITFMELFGLIAALVGAAWGLLKMNARQFSQGLDERFEGILLVMRTRADEQDKKLVHIDQMTTKMQSLELEGLRRHAENLERFCTKTELHAEAMKHDKLLENIFGMLRRIDEKLSNKVDRVECHACKDKQQ